MRGRYSIDKTMAWALIALTAASWFVAGLAVGLWLA